MKKPTFLSVNVLTRVSFAVIVGVGSFGTMQSCGTEGYDSLRPEQTGAIPGKFVTRVSPAFRDSVDKIRKAISKIVPGSDFFSRFSGDDSVFGLTGDNRLSDIFSVQMPDLGTASANKTVYRTLASLGGGDWFQNLDTDKFLGINNTMYDPDTPNDPDMGKQYYLEMINWDSAVTDIEDDALANAAPVIVAVLDTGVQANHEDLADVMFRDPDSGAVVGFDAVADKETANPTDHHGHGSHVAGIIGGTGRNGKGIHGVGFLPRDGSSKDKSVTEIMDIKVLNDNGAGTSEYMTRGIRWAVKKHLETQAKAGREQQKLILNMSLGGPFETEGYEYPLDEDGVPILKDDMFDYAAGNDVLIVVAAGNESCGIGGECEIYGTDYNKTYYYPCSYSNVLCVAASTHEDELAGFSNRKNSVGLTAPGWKIYSTVPESESPDKYAYYNGTSQATPVTAGAASVLWSMHPDFSAAEIKAILRKSSAQVQAITGEISSGVGRLDLAKAMEFAAQLRDEGDSPLDAGEIDPAKTGKKVELPTNDGDDPSAPSDRIAGDGNSGKTCGVVGHRGAKGWWFILLTLPLLAILTRRRKTL